MGVDGLVEGGLRPHPGFMCIYRFDLESWGAHHNQTSRIIDCFPIVFVIGEDGYGYGFVYRVRRKAVVDFPFHADNADIFVDYFNTQTGAWVKGEVILEDVPLSRREVATNAGKQMSVSVFGRFVYIYLEDNDVAAFYTLYEDPWTYTLLTSPGPGAKPVLKSPKDYTLVTLGAVVTRDGKAGYGRLVLIDMLPWETGLFTGQFDLDGTHHTVGSADDFPYPDDTSQQTRIAPGDYAFSYVLFNSENGRRSALSDVAPLRAQDFDDPATPVTRESTPLFAAIEIAYDEARYDQAYIYRSVRVQSAGGTYIASILQLDRIITLADYKTVNNPLAPGEGTHIIYWYKLEDKQLVFQDVFLDRNVFDEELPKGGCSLIYNNVMLVSNISNANTSSSSENSPGDALRGLGELRWSSLTDVSPELFPPQNRYVPSLLNNTIIAMAEVGPNAIGFSRDRQYHIRIEANYIKVQMMHEGYGIVNERAMDTVGSMLYFVSSKGIKSVDSMGSLDDVRNFNTTVMGRWKDTLGSVSCAYDGLTSSWTAMNGDLGEAVIFWFTTAKMTELSDLPFTLVRRGAWPEGVNIETLPASENFFNPLVERAIYVMNAQRENNNREPITGTYFGLYVTDSKRERGEYGLVQGGGWIATVAADSLYYSNLTVDATGVGGDGLELYILRAADPTIVGKHVTIAKIPNAVTIQLIYDDLLLPDNGFDRLVTGDIVGVSPVIFRWVGAPVGSVEESQQIFGGGTTAENFFRVKQINSVTAHFTDVGGFVPDDYPTLCRFSGLVYRGDATEPHARAETLDTNGAPVKSILEDEAKWAAAFGSGEGAAKWGVTGATLAPGIEIVCPGLDFKMCGVLVSGKLLSTFSQQRRPL